MVGASCFVGDGDGFGDGVAFWNAFCKVFFDFGVVSNFWESSSSSLLPATSGFNFFCSNSSSSLEANPASSSNASRLSIFSSSRMILFLLEICDITGANSSSSSLLSTSIFTTAFGGVFFSDSLAFSFSFSFSAPFLAAAANCLAIEFCFPSVAFVVDFVVDSDLEVEIGLVVDSDLEDALVVEEVVVLGRICGFSSILAGAGTTGRGALARVRSES